MLQTSLSVQACPKCQNTLRDGARFCAACGDALAPPAAVVVSCPTCGVPVAPGARFCKRDGTRLQGGGVPSPARQAPPRVPAPAATAQSACGATDTHPGFSEDFAEQGEPIAVERARAVDQAAESPEAPLRARPRSAPAVSIPPASTASRGGRRNLAPMPSFASAAAPKSRVPWLPLVLGGAAALLLVAALVMMRAKPEVAAQNGAAPADRSAADPGTATSPARAPSPAAPPVVEGETTEGSATAEASETGDLATAAPGPSSTLDLQLQSLETGDPRQRAEAAARLGAMGRRARRAVPALVEALLDTDPATQEQAALALAAIGDRAAVPGIVRALQRGQVSTGLVKGVASALETLRDPRASAAVPDLIEALRLSDAEARQAAARALGALGDRRAMEPLLQLAQADVDPAVRAAAAQAAERLDPSARTRLALASWFSKIEDAVKQGRLVAPESDCAVSLAVEAVAAAGPGPESDAVLIAVSRALEHEGARLSQAEGPEAVLALATQAAALVPERPALAAWRASLEKARLLALEAAREFKVEHSHGMALGLNGARLSRSGCVGTLELTEEGFRFRTLQSRDGRRDDVFVRRAQLRKVEMKNDGRQLRVTSSEGNWDFVAEPGDLTRIHAFLTRSGAAGGR